MKKQILISAGPTREKIDAVRFLSNRSTGKMGYALAQAALEMGLEVTLVSGPVSLDAPKGVHFIPVESAREMADAVKSAAVKMDYIIMAAAVADYRPKQAIPNKMKKTDGDLVLALERTEDILATLGQTKRPGQILIGFAAETDNLLDYAQAKLEKKNLDYIVANDVRQSDRGFGSDNNAVTILSRTAPPKTLPLAAKSDIARAILQTVITL